MKKILFVDDDESICFFMRVIIGKNYEVGIANNGKDAFYHLSEGYIPDLIITDINMPLLNGIDLIRHLKTSRIYRDIPIIVLSGHSKISYKDTCKSLGVNTYITKPFDPNELKKSISKEINQ